VQITNGHLSDTTHLTRKTCGTLNAFQSASGHQLLDCVGAIDWARIDAGTILGSECSRRVQSTVNAITTLAHESMHLRGWISESQAQCYAVQEVAWTVVRLGGTPDEGTAVARFALAEQPAMPADYQSSDCRAGGASTSTRRRPRSRPKRCRAPAGGARRAGASSVGRASVSSARAEGRGSGCSAASPPPSTARRSTTAPGG
jgi:hypothetical protein